MHQCINSSDTVGITVFSNPDKPAITLSLNLLVSDADSGNQWYMDNEIIIGEVNDSLQVTSPGNYFLKVTSQAGCSVYSDTVNIAVLGLENKIEQGIRIYPNPAKNILTIKSGLKGPGKVTIMDLSGRIYLERDLIFTGKDELALRGITTGGYLLILKCKNNNYLRRILIE